MTRIADQARRCHADMVVTTEKDAMRMASLRFSGSALAYLPMRVTIESGMSEWLMNRLRAGARVQ
jgi:hypothetical protein